MTTLRAQDSEQDPIAVDKRKVEDLAATRDYSKLRRVAATQPPSRLKEAIVQGGWTAKDIDDNDAYNQKKGQQKQRQHASKSAMHMAAWKGCLDNVKYLVEDIGCNIDSYSKQEFSYGKTAIFFALTQSRRDVTEYLLQRGAKVTIVNNKGQSVLSLASSHFQDSHDNTIIETIQKLEKEQGDWWNFRASHSDGFEYGDLDPRFFNDRPLKDTDVVTSFAINPTTKKTRKGGFLRRNPEATKWTNAHGGEKPKQSKKRNRKKPPLQTLSVEEQSKLNEAWESLQSQTLPISLETFDEKALLEILRLSDKQRSSWIPQATTRLAEMFGKDNSIEIIERVISHPDAIPQRQLQLLTKMLTKFKAEHDQQRQKLLPQNTKRIESEYSSHHSELWKIARTEVEDLCISCLEESDSPILKLTQPPIFVDTALVMNNVLETFSNSKLVGIDTEWYTPLPRRNEESITKPNVALSTLQVAFWNSKEHVLSSYVIDLIQKEGSSIQKSEFQRLAKGFARKLLDACTRSANPGLPLVLGFAISHDLPLLEQYVNQSKDDGIHVVEDLDNKNPPCYSRVLDLQQLLAKDIDEQIVKRKTGPPGLKTCVAKYSTVPLSKDCQCSDWEARPLSQAQLDYAGLDAAILLVLLAERSRHESLSSEIAAE